MNITYDVGWPVEMVDISPSPCTIGNSASDEAKAREALPILIKFSTDRKATIAALEELKSNLLDIGLSLDRWDMELPTYRVNNPSNLMVETKLTGRVIYNFELSQLDKFSLGEDLNIQISGYL